MSNYRKGEPEERIKWVLLALALPLTLLLMYCAKHTN